MKFLLTSAGIKNASIMGALLDLLGKPIAEANALLIPTAIYPFPGGPGMGYRFISGKTPNPLVELGWKSLGVLELTALPSIKAEYWRARSRRRTPCWCRVAMCCIWPAGCASPGWPTSYHRCARRSMWG
jgi:dipeptidase E